MHFAGSKDPASEDQCQPIHLILGLADQAELRTQTKG